MFFFYVLDEIFVSCIKFVIIFKFILLWVIYCEILKGCVKINFYFKKRFGKMLFFDGESIVCR